MFSICLELEKRIAYFFSSYVFHWEKNSNFSVSFSSTQLFSSGFVMSSWVFFAAVSSSWGCHSFLFFYSKGIAHLCQKKKEDWVIGLFDSIGFFSFDFFHKTQKKEVKYNATFFSNIFCCIFFPSFGSAAISLHGQQMGSSKEETHCLRVLLRSKELKAPVEYSGMHVWVCCWAIGVCVCEKKTLLNVQWWLWLVVAVTVCVPRLILIYTHEHRCGCCVIALMLLALDDVAPYPWVSPTNWNYSHHRLRLCHQHVHCRRHQHRYHPSQAFARAQLIQFFFVVVIVVEFLCWPGRVIWWTIRRRSRYTTNVVHRRCRRSSRVTRWQM